jgi:YVTN family beta-propeller protein
LLLLFTLFTVNIYDIKIKTLHTFFIINNLFDDTQKFLSDNLFFTFISIISANALDESASKTSIPYPSFPYNGIKVSGSPFALSVNNNSDVVYVIDKFLKKITLIDDNSDRQTDKIVINNTNSAAANIRGDIDLRSAIDVDTESDLLYIATTDSNIISAIEGSEGSIISRYHVAGSPFDLIVNSQSNRIYSITNTPDPYKSSYGNGTIYKINGFFNRIESNLTLPNDFFVAVDIDPITQKVYVMGLNKLYIFTENVNQLEQFKNFSTPGVLPHDMALDINSKKLYIVDRNEPFLYTIDIDTINENTNPDRIKIDEIKIPAPSTALAINPQNSMIYVTNPDVNKVSVINGTTNELVDSILVGNNPRNIAFNPKTNIIYVSNMLSDNISILNGTSNNLVGGITFETNPPSSGIIYCNNQKMNNYNRYDIGTFLKCQPKANEGFTFSSWTSDLILNDTKTRSSIFDSTPTTGVIVSKFGTLTANFVPQAPISPEFWAPLYGLIPGFFIPSIISWFIDKRQRNYFRKYRKKIDEYIDQYKTNQFDYTQFLENLNEIKKEVIEEYEKGRISESHQSILTDRINNQFDKH